MARIAYDEQMAAAYDRGSALEMDGLAASRDAVSEYLPGPSGLPVELMVRTLGEGPGTTP